jgi:hypothetical protein
MTIKFKDIKKPKQYDLLLELPDWDQWVYGVWAYEPPHSYYGAYVIFATESSNDD